MTKALTCEMCDKRPADETFVMQKGKQVCLPCMAKTPEHIDASEQIAAMYENGARKLEEQAMMLRRRAMEVRNNKEA